MPGKVLWRSTFNDGFIPVTSFVDHNREKNEKELKNQVPYDQLMKEPIMRFKINGE